jgi:polyferredoxin
MGEAGLAVLIMVLIVGLVVAFLLPWASLLASTGHPTRKAAREAGPPMPRRRVIERHTGRAALGAILAIYVTALLLTLMVPDLITDLPIVDDLPRATLVFAFAAFIVSVVYALPAWLGVRQ